VLGRSVSGALPILESVAETFLLAIDQGTTSSRALVVDGAGGIRGIGQLPFQQHFPRPGWVEHDPEEIWSTTLEAIAGALAAANIRPAGVAAMGITNQRETLVAWDRRTGEPLHRAIVWQDRRTADLCQQLRDDGHEALVQQRTGLTIDPYFSGTKASWLLREVPRVASAASAGDLALGTVDSWLIWKLTGGQRHVTDYTNACRTMLFDIHRARWDEELCALLGVPIGALAEPLPSRSEFGVCSREVIGAEIPILAVAGDQQAALFGQAAFERGQAKNTYGTGCFLIGQAGGEAPVSANRLLTSLTAGAAPGRLEFLVEGSVFVAGSLVQWLRDELKLVERSEDIEALAASVPDAGGVTIVPAFTGLGAPYWDAGARGAILGLTRGTTAAHIARAALEAIALASAELVGALASDLGAPVTELRVDGGAASNNLLMQMQADFAGLPVLRPAATETTALGAAYLAGIGCGAWAGQDEIAALWKLERRFEPALAEGEREAKLHEWRRAVRRVLSDEGA